ncbi:MAG: XdhC family protein [Bacteroidetes bacterium]|nr:XdhC family protein [Bacteroidota bacterium]
MVALNFWNFIFAELKADKKIAILIVADSSNSSPGRQGFKMAIAENSEVFGTIGGGIMENDISEFTLDLMSSENDTAIKRLFHSNTSIHQKSGLNCGGRQTVIIKILTKKHLTKIGQIIENLAQRKKGELLISESDFSYSNNSNLTKIHFKDEETNWEYKEQVGFIETAYVIGGGHIGLAVSKIIKSLGFYVVVLDNRADVYTIKQNIYADKIIICKYNEVGSKIIEGNKSFIIITTSNYLSDIVALKSVINKNVKYIGLMGSKRKIKTIFNSLTEEGIDKKLFSKVHTPIGLEIEAETPEEIAVSIAAEIIKVKNSVTVGLYTDMKL